MSITTGTVVWDAKRFPGDRPPNDEVTAVDNVVLVIILKNEFPSWVFFMIGIFMFKLFPPPS
jgi:hypothetical protein